MIPWEKRVILKHYLEQGVSISVLAAQLGIGRRTIHRWIREGQLDRDVDAGEACYTARPPRPHKLDAYTELIRTRLDVYPKLSATRLFTDVKAGGYVGGYDAVMVFARQVRPRSVEEAVVRFETAPGHQAQVDFARFHFPWGVRHALLVVLGYSRLLWLGFYIRQDMRTLFAGLETAFACFGGVPRELLFDQMKAVITRDLRLEGGGLIENAEFLRFAHHWGFRPRACRPYRAQTKGKVERPIRYVRESFVYGREFLGDADLDAQARAWLAQVANVRLHQTTKERPVDRFLQERELLLPMAEYPYRSLVLRPSAPEPKAMRPLPRVQVERRPLRAYAQIAAGAA